LKLRTDIVPLETIPFPYIFFSHL